VTPVPQILLADRQEIVDALERLRLCLCDGAARGP
jgi:hypothetical protein